MASTSTSVSTSYASNYQVYDVFINHRGPDSKKTLATYLYDGLREHGLRVFLDQQELIGGDRLTSQIKGAIRTASVHIAILSPRYAESAWCLKELVLMFQTGRPIIPVFYGVQPSEIRWTQGGTGFFDRLLRMLPWVSCILCCTTGEKRLFARCLRELEEKNTIDSQTGQKTLRYNSETIENWRGALSQVADITGFDLDTYNGQEQQLVEKVLEAVLAKVPKKLEVSKYPIALDKKVEDFDREMCLTRQSGQTSIIGIVGLGGIGKTTLSKEIFNRRSSNYDRSCFLSDVRDKPLNLLQSVLLKDLAQMDKQINNIDEGIIMLRKYLTSVKALIIADDVDHIRQMDALLSPAKDALHPGSFILVTSRNKDVLTNWGVVESSIYKLTGLDLQHSKELFCSHAFHKCLPVLGFEKVVDQFLNVCDGLPLSLRVLGALLHGKNLKYWEAQLRKISKVLPTDIQSRLRISYDGLKKEEKLIFLDIASFFIREDRDTAVRIWDGSGWEGEAVLQNLKDRCLVEVDSANLLTMQDPLRDMARDIAEKDPPDRRLRLWRPANNHLNMNDRLLVRGISIDLLGSEWTPQTFENLAEYMSSLQLVRAEGHSVRSIFRVGQKPPLIWLCWKDCPYPSMPSWIPTENLRVLQIKGCHFEKVWTHEFQAPMQIRELDIEGTVLDIPENIGMLNLLEKLVLKLMSLQCLPDSLGNLRSLQTIVLSCPSLQCLPHSLSDLRTLQTINLYGCSSLQCLPDSLGKLTSLQTINLVLLLQPAVPPRLPPQLKEPPNH